MSETNQIAIESILHEDRIFPPPAEFSANAHIKSFAEYEEIYKRAAEDPEAFWASVAENLHWFKKWDTVLKWKEPHAEWFVGGKINASYNCLDRHLENYRMRRADAGAGEHRNRQFGNERHIERNSVAGFYADFFHYIGKF